MIVEMKFKGSMTPEEVKEVLSHAPWAADRPLSHIKEMLDGTSFAVLLINPRDSKPVGFARIITDGVYRAFIEDVVVHTDHRGIGLGRLLIWVLESHMRRAKIERAELCTSKTGFWEHLGYKPKNGHMIKYNKGE